MKVNVIDISGNVKTEISLPAVFEDAYRPDLIKKAVLSAQANRMQAYGPNKRSGMNTSARSWGSGRGAAQIPRIVNGSRAARVPQARGGRRAHPPKPETDKTEKINKKEKKNAIRSAIAATANTDLVKQRGHLFDAQIPIVASNELEELLKTKEVIEFLKIAGVYDDVIRAKIGRNIRAGKGKLRGRKYRHKKSVLIVTGAKSQILKSAANLPGVEITPCDALNAEILAPGTHAGRLTIWTESAIEQLTERFSNDSTILENV